MHSLDHQLKTHQILHDDLYMYIKKQMLLSKQSLPATENRIKQIRDCQQKDKTCKLVSSYCFSSCLATQKVSTN